MVSESVAIAAAGAAIGVPLALVSGMLLRGLLFDVSSADPVTLAAASLSFIAIGIVAALVPARRAASVNPTVALRAE